MSGKIFEQIPSNSIGVFDVDRLSDNDMFWVAAIKKDSNGGVEVKFHDRTKAIELLFKHLESANKNDNGIADILHAIENSASLKEDE